MCFNKINYFSYEYCNENVTHILFSNITVNVFRDSTYILIYCLMQLLTPVPSFLGRGNNIKYLVTDVL